MSNPQNIFEKIWDMHVVKNLQGNRSIIYVDRHLLHEVTSPQAFDGLRQRKLKVRCPEKTFATEDHNVPTNKESLLALEKWSKKDSYLQVQTLRKNCEEFGITLWPVSSPYQGIVHVVGPELGLITPGMVTVCGDSHTSTHGAFGSYSLGIGTTEIEMVLASQCLILEKPTTFEVRVEGELQPGVTAKDVILHIIRKVGIGGGRGSVFIYTGSTFRNMSMEERMTVCNMSIEGGARAGLVEPDETTIEYLKGRKFVPQGEAFEKIAEEWLRLKSDEGARFDRSQTFQAEEIQPTVTWGTNPDQGITLDEAIPDSSTGKSPDAQRNLQRALEYMEVTPGSHLQDLPLTTVFIGSCTNSRISDLRTAAAVLKDKKVKEGMRVLIVPGSMQVKKQAEAEKLDQIFTKAGAEWRSAGCSLCIAMNGDIVPVGERCATTSNRNFEGRQGKGSRSHLCSPTVAACAAILGRFPTFKELKKMVTL